MTKEELLKNFRDDIYCRVKPSSIDGGVGVFAVRKIPKGVNPFVGAPEETNIPLTLEEVASFDLTVQRLAKDFCIFKDGMYWSSPRGLNNLDIVFYINHSDTPNLELRGKEFFAAKDIEAGEELTDNYLEFDDIGIEP
jgi:hypothetical protein